MLALTQVVYGEMLVMILPTKLGIGIWIYVHVAIVGLLAQLAGTTAVRTIEYVLSVHIHTPMCRKWGATQVFCQSALQLSLQYQPDLVTTVLLPGILACNVQFVYLEWMMWSPFPKRPASPERRGGLAVPKAKRGRAGDNRRLRDYEADVSAASEPPLALTNRPENVIRVHRSEDDTDDACYVVLTMMNGDQLSYKLPLSVSEIRKRLPQLPFYTMYKLVHGTNLLKGSQVLDGMNYHLSVIVVKVDFADWLPKSWIGAVPNEAQDRLGYLPGSISEAGMAVFHCMVSRRVDVASLDFGADMDRRIEMATRYIIEGCGWQTWAFWLQVALVHTIQ